MNWKIIEPVALELRSGRVRNSYLIECKCGYRRHIHVSEWPRFLDGTHKANIRAGCRKCNLLDKPTSEKINSGYRYLYNSLKSSCKRIKRDFELSYEEACTLYKGNCAYCGKPPSNTVKVNVEKFGVKYNGIDRIDSSKGYVENNVAPCCYTCNRFKSDLALPDFLEHVENIYCFRVQRLSWKGVEPSGSKLRTSEKKNQMKI